MDAPHCCFKKVEFIDRNHDLFCTLYKDDTCHRITTSGLNFKIAMNDRSVDIEKKLTTFAAHPDAKLILLASMPIASITGVQYDQIIRHAHKRIKKDIFEIPAQSLLKYYLTGYEDVLSAIAKKIPVDLKNKKKKTAALIGYFMDRNEGDHVANVELFRDIFRKLGYQLSSVWLEGGTYQQLKKVDQADMIFSLPYGRNAASILARRTRTRHIPLEIPFGIEGASRCIRAIGAAVGEKERAEKIIAAELKKVIPIMQRIAPLFILGRSFTLCCDTFFAGPLSSALEEFGGVIRHIVHFGRDDRAFPDLKPGALGKITADDIVIGNSYALEIEPALHNSIYVQFGFPSPGNHYLVREPTLGYHGFIHSINKVLNKMNS